MSPASELIEVNGAGAGLVHARRPTLLVVDDEAGPRQSLHMVFKDDYEVLLAETGPAALDLARRHGIDAAILDIRMPGMNGVEVLARLKELHPAVEVIMLTAYETVDTARQALRLGACDYLTKPFELATIRDAVAKAMEKHFIARQIELNNGRLLELQEDLRKLQLQGEIDRTKGEIYASILHDMNGPLTIISGFVEIIYQHVTTAHSLEGENLELVKDRLSRIIRQVNSCIEITQRYLSFLRKSPGQPRVAVGARTVLNDLGELLRVHPHAHRNKLIILPLQEDVVTEINGTELIQMLLNLTINALQCSPEPHEVEIHGQRLVEPLNLAQFPDNRECRFLNREVFRNQAPLLAVSVRDNGPGIPSENLARIFEPGFTTKPVGKGTGLGLSIVHRFIREYCGGLYVQTHLGQGTTFTVFLPARS